MSETVTTAEGAVKPVTPGEVLMEEFLKPAGLSQAALARAIRVPPHRIRGVVRGHAVSADLDLRLARYWGVSEGFFLNLQKSYELRTQRPKIAAALEQITPRAA